MALYHDCIEGYRRRLLAGALKRAGGNISRMARTLGLQRTYACRLLRERGLHGRGPHAPKKRGG